MNQSTIIILVVISFFVLVFAWLVYQVILQNKKKDRIISIATKIDTLTINLDDRAKEIKIPFKLEIGDKYLIIESTYSSEMTESISGLLNFESVIDQISGFGLDKAIKLQTIQRSGDYNTNVDLSGDHKLPFIKLTFKNLQTSKEIYRYFSGTDSVSGFNEYKYGSSTSWGGTEGGGILSFFSSARKRITSKAKSGSVWDITGILEPGDYEMVLQIGDFDFKKMGSISVEKFQMELNLMKAQDETKVLVKK